MTFCYDLFTHKKYIFFAFCYFLFSMFKILLTFYFYEIIFTFNSSFATIYIFSFFSIVNFITVVKLKEQKRFQFYFLVFKYFNVFFCFLRLARKNERFQYSAVKQQLKGKFSELLHNGSKVAS